MFTSKKDVREEGHRAAIDLNKILRTTFVG
jgi:hypothetical protein